MAVAAVLDLDEAAGARSPCSPLCARRSTSCSRSAHAPRSARHLGRDVVGGTDERPSRAGSISANCAGVEIDRAARRRSTCAGRAQRAPHRLARLGLGLAR